MELDPEMVKWIRQWHKDFDKCWRGFSYISNYQQLSDSVSIVGVGDACWHYEYHILMTFKHDTTFIGKITVHTANEFGATERHSTWENDSTFVLKDSLEFHHGMENAQIKHLGKWRIQKDGEFVRLD